jgi:hypothetical protein
VQQFASCSNRFLLVPIQAAILLAAVSTVLLVMCVNRQHQLFVQNTTKLLETALFSPAYTACGAQLSYY